MVAETDETEIAVADLRIGMRVVRLDVPWEETEFLFQGFIIESEDELRALQSRCKRVWIEARREIGPVRANVHVTTRITPRMRRSIDTGTAPSSPSQHSPLYRYRDQVDAQTELKPARKAYISALRQAHVIMNGLRLGNVLDMEATHAVVNACVESILRNSDAMLLLSRLKDRHNYTAEHCLHVGILCATFARHLGLKESEIRVAALCGLLHDVGKARIDTGILDKPGALTPAEYRIMQQHTVYGREILLEYAAINADAVDATFCHHERFDGSGYPRGLTAVDIPRFARIVSICDTYDAITSHRAYDKGRASMDALDIIHRCRGSQFDSELAEQFIQCIGIYPPGSIVELSSGEAGIVTASNPHNKLRPQVLVVRDARKGKLEKYRLVDLAMTPVDADGKHYTLAREVPDGTYGIRLKHFLDQGLGVGTAIRQDTSRASRNGPARGRK